MLDILKLDHLFERDLEIIHDCESRSVKEFAKIIPKISSDRLQGAFNNDLARTTTHLEWLNRIFASRNSLPVEERDHALKGIFHEGEELIKSIDQSALLDAALVVFGSQIHHHKIALYESLWTLALALNLTEAAAPLKQAIDEEMAAAETLLQIGLQSVMPEAVNVANPKRSWEII